MFRRFVAQRGRPAIVYSDNGTNFVGLDNAFTHLEWEKIPKHCAIERIEWRFNPPAAAWWGGWWERLIRLLKQLLCKTLGKASLTYEELETTLCDCESVINNETSDIRVQGWHRFGTHHSQYVFVGHQRSRNSGL
jgi:hypothetical protein